MISKRPTNSNSKYFCFSCSLILFLSDIDECGEDPNLCGENSVCVNIIGRYLCMCVKGFDRVEDSCQGSYNTI